MKLDKYQMEAVEAKEKNILVVAAPGSGKTTVIINRIDYLIRKKLISEDNIIVITFTKAAALNMKDRYKKAFNRSKTPFFGTFHGLFYQILKRYGININIIQGYISNKIMESVLRRYFDEVNEDKIKEALNNISLYKTSRNTLEAFKPSFSKDIFIECLEAYSKYKDENNLMDFDDLAIEALKLFENNKGIREGYKGLFKYVLVDEFQDCDELQIDFLNLINKGNENNLFAVGDEDQCIYSFRGSKPEYMVTFNKIFTGGKKYYLSKNYRSTKNIIELSKKIISHNKKRNKKEILWNNEKDGIIEFQESSSERLQCEEISNKIQELIKGNYNYSDNIVLYRTNIESMSIIDVFIRRNMPFTMIDREYNFFSHFICRDLLSYLQLVYNNNDREAFLKIINKPFRYISKINLSYVRDYKEDINPFDILIQKEDTPSFQRKKLDDLKRDFAFLSKSSLNVAIQYIISEMGYIDYLKEYSKKFSSSIEDLEEIVEAFKTSAAEFKSIPEFFAHVEEFNKNIEESKKSTDKNRILLSTIHGVKGMEFPNVFIMNCIEDIIPHASSKDTNIEEERRLFYVAITRAIQNLYLYAPRVKGNNIKEVSRFIKEGELKLQKATQKGLVKGAKIKHNAFGIGIVQSISDNEISILFENGVRRNFVLDILLRSKLIEVLE